MLKRAMKLKDNRVIEEECEDVYAITCDCCNKIIGYIRNNPKDVDLITDNHEQLKYYKCSVSDPYYHPSERKYHTCSIGCLYDILIQKHPMTPDSIDIDKVANLGLCPTDFQYGLLNR